MVQELTLPDTPLEESIFDAIAVINSTEKEYSPPETSTGHYQLCPIPGCGRGVKRLWNHLNQFHKKRGDHTALLPRKTLWSADEEHVLREEYALEPGVHVPSTKVCQVILDQHQELFQNRTKVDIQDKYRRLIKK